MKADLAMAIHFHQPVGNFDDVVERACDNCYVPFLKMLKKYPEIKMTFHFTGCLLEWAEKNKPELIEMVKVLTKRGQVEVMSGGFYEPILPSIPPGDRISQIKMLTKYVKDNFSFEAKGAWVAERVWEPALASTFYDAGIKYVILDDTHFSYAGLDKKDTYGFYLTEDDAKPVAVFPSDKTLRYSIPFKMPHECIEYMKEVLKAEDNQLFIYGDDGEKFGEWPGTHKWVYEEKWLEKFFNELMHNKDWLKTITLSEALESRKAKGRVYLPSASYEEMLKWALPADAQEKFEDIEKEVANLGAEERFKPFLRGGFWRNFLTKYPESNHMNKKMVHVSRKLEYLREKGVKEQVLQEAEKDLFRGQCNCAYWHGVFGGLYLFHLRRAIYHHLIRSEVQLDNIKHKGRDFCETEVLNLNADGHNEVILSNKQLSLYFAPGEGGILKELDSKEMCQNLINTLSRRKEAYHRKMLEKIENSQDDSSGVKTIHDGIQVVDKSIADELYYDCYNRYSLVDHFISHCMDLEAFSRCQCDEEGDFVKGAYDFDTKVSSKGALLKMARRGKVNGKDVLIIKEVTLPKNGDSFTVNYTIKNESGEEVDSIFGPEFNFTMPDADSERYSLVSNNEESPSGLGDSVQYDGVTQIKIDDSNGDKSIELEFSDECRLWHFPLKTISQSEKAYELNYQSSVIFPHFHLKLGPGKEKKFSIKVKLTK